MGAREVCNFDVAAAFVRQMQSLAHDEGGAEWALPEIVYHWTREENIGRIVENNLRVAGQVNSDGSNVGQAHGAVYGHGIYAATDISFGRHYGHGAPCSILCLALPGRVLEGRRLSEQGSEHSLRHGAMRVYRHTDQLMPLFLTNPTNDAQARRSAEKVVDFLKQKTPISWDIAFVNSW